MPHKPSVLFRRTKCPIHFAHLLLEIVGQLMEPQRRRAIRGLVRKATASDDLILNSDEVVHNVHLRGSLSSGESGFHCMFTPASSSLVFGPRGLPTSAWRRGFRSNSLRSVRFNRWIEARSPSSLEASLEVKRNNGYWPTLPFRIAPTP
jgi:hypothetical protein